MGPKRRLRSSKYVEVGHTDTTSDGSSNSDGNTKPRDIINKLAHKYMYRETRSLRKAKEKENEAVLSPDSVNEYDADIDSATELPMTKQDIITSSSEDTSEDPYAFGEDNFRLVLSPNKKVQKQRKQIPMDCDAKQKKSTKKSQQKLVDKKGKPLKPLPKTPIDLPRPSSNQKDSDADSLIRRSSKRKWNKTATVSFDLSDSKDIQSESMVDSGIFVTPHERHVRKMPRIVKDTSTPMYDTKTVSKIAGKADDDLFGFESLITPEPDLSPVKKLNMMDVDEESGDDVDMMLSSIDGIDKNLSIVTADIHPKPNITLYSQMQEESAESDTFSLDSGSSDTKRRKKAEKQKQVSVKVNPAVEKWADKMNDEFSEIELYELSIEVDND